MFSECQSCLDRKASYILFTCAIGNTLFCLCGKCAIYHALDSRQARYEIRQEALVLKKGAVITSHVFRTSVQSPRPKENITFVIYFETAFNSVNRQFMLEKIFKICFSTFWNAACGLRNWNITVCSRI